MNERDETYLVLFLYSRKLDYAITETMKSTICPARHSGGGLQEAPRAEVSLGRGTGGGEFEFILSKSRFWDRSAIFVENSKAKQNCTISEPCLGPCESLHLVRRSETDHITSG